MTEPIRVFCGCAPNNDDLESQSVFELTLRAHTRRHVEITWMQLSRDPVSPWYSNGSHGWQTEFWTTPFSGFRWAVPEICGFEGEAIYCDSDIIFFADIGLLWDEPIEPGKFAIAKGGVHAPRFCVSKWDCREAQNYLPSIAKLQADPYIHRGLMERFAVRADLFQQFRTGNWNCLDLDDYRTLDDPKLRALHYTSIPTQPQLRHALPRLAKEGGSHWFKGEPRSHPHPEIEQLFDRLLAEAKAIGYGPGRYRRQPYGELRIRNGR